MGIIKIRKDSMRRQYYRILLISALSFLLLYVFSDQALAQNGAAEVGVFEPFQVSPGSTVQVPVSIKGVEGLYGVDFTLKFDPEIIQIQDIDPTMDGIQSSLGDFLDPGLLLFNTADNEAGLLRFTMAQYNPSEPKSGSGNLLVITFKGVATGESPLEIIEVSLSTREGEEIASKSVSGSVLVKNDAPTQAVTYAVVSQPTSLVMLNTFTPTATYTAVPTATPRPIMTSSLSAEQPETGGVLIEQNTVNENGTGVPFLVENWWLLPVLLLVVVVIGIFGYRKITRDNKGS